MEFNKVKQSQAVKFQGRIGKVVTKIRPDACAWVKFDDETIRVDVEDLRAIEVEPKLSSIIGDSEERKLFKSSMAEAKEREDDKPLNHDKQYTKEECTQLMYEFADMVTASGHITNLSEWIEKCSMMGEKLQRTVIAISTEASRIHFVYGKGSPVIRAVIEDAGLVRIVPSRKTTRILRYMVHNWK